MMFTFIDFLLEKSTPSQFSFSRGVSSGGGSTFSHFFRSPGIYSMIFIIN